ncbi:MAG: sensor histidine kinase [Bacteroidetes bacterium]|nr:MAG: sensor histidine kinase [Bacteroidota bacterium]
MKGISLDSRKIEFLIYFLIWAFVFSVPYFSERGSGHINWNEVIKNWLRVVSYLVIFLVNVYILVPRLLLKKKYRYYFVLVSVLIAMVIIVNIPAPIPYPQQNGPLTEANNDSLEQPVEIVRKQKPPIMAFADNLIISILLVGAGTTVKLMSKWLSEEKLRKDAEKEQLKTNLALLKHQVSPHFFMNTLNNIHTLIEMDTEKAQDAVERLSTLMRYLLYDSAQNTIELKKEIEFIYSFISLMQLRHSDEVEVTVLIPNQIPDIKIPPMLFISLLENAFKHGVSYPKKSYIYFEIQIHEKTLGCIIKNSKHKTVLNQYDEYSGIGLANIKKSLNLLYEQDYKLDISNKENEFEVNLTIPV